MVGATKTANCVPFAPQVMCNAGVSALYVFHFMILFGERKQPAQRAHNGALHGIATWRTHPFATTKSRKSQNHCTKSEKVKTTVQL
jgi:hypothetical protein